MELRTGMYSTACLCVWVGGVPQTTQETLHDFLPTRSTPRVLAETQRLPMRHPRNSPCDDHILFRLTPWVKHSTNVAAAQLDSMTETCCDRVCKNISQTTTAIQKGTSRKRPQTSSISNVLQTHTHKAKMVENANRFCRFKLRHTAKAKVARVLVVFSFHSSENPNLSAQGQDGIGKIWQNADNAPMHFAPSMALPMTSCTSLMAGQPLLPVYAIRFFQSPQVGMHSHQDLYHSSHEALTGAEAEAANRSTSNHPWNILGHPGTMVNGQQKHKKRMKSCNLLLSKTNAQ